MLDDELESSTTVAVLQESRHYKLKENQLQLYLTNRADGTTCTWSKEREREREKGGLGRVEG